tara:strand:- start:442 stop:714 length:273 start_codon:yes stop_codon:yes gene_type:complete
MNKEDQDKTLEKDDVLWLNDIKKAREIVQEILRFGVTQPQMKSIISILALELEDRELMISIRNTIDPVESDETTDGNHVKILYPGGNENE